MKKSGDYMNDYLKHYGILGMKWGVRRYQNKDGTLTSAGKNRKDRVSKAADKVASLNEKRKTIQNTKGVATRAYINTSKDLLYAKGKLKFETGKRDKDKTLELNGKNMMKEAKLLKRPDAWAMMGFDNKKYLYPSNLSSQDRKAINYLEYEKFIKNDKVQRLKRPLKAASVGVGLTLGIGVGKELIRSKGEIPLSAFITKGNGVAVGKAAAFSFIDSVAGMPISDLIFKK